MKPMIIDVAGTIKELVKWVLTQALLLLGILMFGLSAPLLFTVGAEWLAWRYRTYASTWAVIYMFAGPFACTFWMILMCHWPATRRILEAIAHCSEVAPLPATVSQGTATSLPWTEGYFDLVLTDPPYYDSVPYSHLSDFFYVWLKRTVGEL